MKLTSDKWSFTLDKPGVYSIGRKGDIVVGDVLIDRVHARIHHSKHMTAIEDAMSSSGTRVNGVRIRELTELAPGDKVQCGGVSFVVQR